MNKTHQILRHKHAVSKKEGQVEFKQMSSTHLLPLLKDSCLMDFSSFELVVTLLTPKNDS